MEKDDITINPRTYSLYEVMLSLQSVMQKSYGNRHFWVRCELSRLSLHAQSGHCYLELVDKNNSVVMAQQKGVIWSDKYQPISEKFRQVTGSPLSSGMKVLFLCAVIFHPLHGLSLSITDIEPSFTMGEMARMKNEAIARLKSENLFHLNKDTTLPLLPSRIAIISVDSSRGYQDFVSTIHGHGRNYKISYRLFDAILQGENAVPSLTRAINKIVAQKGLFDAIAIIRGGAGDAGLSCYDEYSLAALISQCPLPVVTGIGHATNETVVEMVSYKNCITPTAAATFFLTCFDTQNYLIQNFVNTFHDLLPSRISHLHKESNFHSERFILLVQSQLNKEGYTLKKLHAGIHGYVSKYFSSGIHTLFSIRQSLMHVSRNGMHVVLLSELKSLIDSFILKSSTSVQSQRNLFEENVIKINVATETIKKKSELLKHLNEKVTLLDPINTLLRGYSITRQEGKAITNASEIHSGTLLKTEVASGTIISIAK